MDRATIRQKKTRRAVRFELTDQTGWRSTEYLRLTGRKPGQFRFAGRGDASRGLRTRQIARLMQDWVASIGLDPAKLCASPHQGGADGLCSALKLIDPEVAIRLSGGWHGRQEISGTSGSA